MTVPNKYVAKVTLSEEDITTAKRLYEKYPPEKNMYLHHFFCGLINGEIDKNEPHSFHTDGRTIRELVRLYSTEKPSKVQKLCLCKAKGLYFCSPKELEEAGIEM